MRRPPMSRWPKSSAVTFVVNCADTPSPVSVIESSGDTGSSEATDSVATPGSRRRRIEHHRQQQLGVRPDGQRKRRGGFELEVVGVRAADVDLRDRQREGPAQIADLHDSLGNRARRHVGRDELQGDGDELSLGFDTGARQRNGQRRQQVGGVRRDRQLRHLRPVAAGIEAELELTAVAHRQSADVGTNESEISGIDARNREVAGELERGTTSIGQRERFQSPPRR